MEGSRPEILYTVLDWFDRHTQGTWQELRGDNRLATGYAARRLLMPHLPKGDEVVVLSDRGSRTLAVHDVEIIKRENPDG